jgi:hypothetical protein
VVVGLAFHRNVFAARSRERQLAIAAGHAPRPPSASTIASPHVRLLDPKTAVVAYNRIVQRANAPNEVFGETRVWKLGPAGWKQVHFHRSAVAVAPSGTSAPGSLRDRDSIAGKHSGHREHATKRA